MCFNYPSVDYSKKFSRKELSVLHQIKSLDIDMIRAQMNSLAIQLQAIDKNMKELLDKNKCGHCGGTGKKPEEKCQE